MIPDKKMEYAIRQFGTPLYVFDLDELRDSVGRLREKTDPVAGLTYAMKANPFLTAYMADLVDRIEVCSMGEYEICRALKIKPEKLLISGVLKKETDMEKILGECRGRCIYTVESVSQFSQFVRWSRQHGEHLRLYLRLSSGNKFGMDPETVKDLISVRDVCQQIEIAGLHYFSGTQKRSSETFGKELDLIDEFIRSAEDRRFFLKDLEYGPGLAMPYFEGQPDRRDADLDALCEAVRKLNGRKTVFLEMGRFLSASCGYYLTSVMDMKTSSRQHYCIVDGGIHHLHYDGQIRGMYQPYMSCIPSRDYGYAEDWIVCGALCTDNDILVRKCRLGGIKVGDVLVFHRAGAYSMTEGMTLFLSHPLPKVALYSKKEGWRLVRPEQPTYIWNMENPAQKESENAERRNG